MKIEAEAHDAFGMRTNPNRPKPKINKKLKAQETQVEDEYDGAMIYYKRPLAPPQEWEKTHETLLPYNMKSY